MANLEMYLLFINGFGLIYRPDTSKANYELINRLCIYNKIYATGTFA